MAVVVGGIGSTHVPAIGKAIADKKQNDPYWQPFFKGFDYVHYWLARAKPDVAVVFYNDHGLNFFLDKIPTFAVGAAAEYRSEDEGWGIPVSRPIPGDPALSWHLINALVADDFDVTMCQDMLIDHAVTIPMALTWPGPTWPVKIIPVEINTVQHPLPSMARCLKLGRSIGRAIEFVPTGFTRRCHRNRRAVASARRQAGRVHQQGIRRTLPQQDHSRAGSAHPVFDPRRSRAVRVAGCRISQLDGDARRDDGAGERA